MSRVNTLLSRWKRQGYFEVNFYRVHVLYFIFTILLTSVILWGSGANGNSKDEDALFPLSFIDALFLCTSAMTNTGLNTVNLSSITAFQQSILFILMLFGNVTIVSIATILVRRHWFRKYMQEFLEKNEGGRKILDEIDREENGQVKTSNNRINPANPTVRRRRPELEKEQPQSAETQTRSRHHERGHGGLPYPWDWSIARNLGSKYGKSGASRSRNHHYLSFEPSLDDKVGLVQICSANPALTQQGRFHSLNEHEREELGGVEYRALGVLLWLLPIYICFWMALSLVILVPWSYKRDVVAILDGPQPGRLKPGWYVLELILLPLVI